MPSPLRLLPSPLRLLFPPALVVVLIVGVLVRGSEHSSSGPSALAGQTFAGAVLPPGVSAHNFTLSNQYGRAVSLSAYRGEVVALTFISTHCRACALVAQQVRGALDELGTASGVRAIFVSTDPRTDTPASIARFLAEASLTGRVEYLTGASARLQRVWRAYRARSASESRSASEAATTVLLIDRAGAERVGFGLEQITPESLAHDIRLLQTS